MLVGAAVALLLSTRTSVDGSPAAACGSGWDVIAGRSGWRQWLAADLADPRSPTRLVRTESCPATVNTHIVIALSLAGVALILIATGEYLARQLPGSQGPGANRRQLRRFGAVTAGLGSVLTVLGLAGLLVLLANPDSPLFLYASRPVVLFCGLLLLLPALVLVALGRATKMLADHLDEVRREPS